MAQWLREDTAVTVLIGPLVDSVDATKEEGLTILSGEVYIWKHGGGSMAAKNDSSSATHRGYGHYSVLLDTTDTDTPGLFTVSIFETGIMVATKDFMIVPQQKWDSIFGSDKLQVDAVEINSSTTAAAQLAKSANQIYSGTVTHTPNASTTTTFESSDITTSTADYWIGRVVIFTSGALAGQATSITDYALNGANGLFTVDALTSGPAAGVTFIIV